MNKPDYYVPAPVQADGYKISHEGFQPEGTEYIYSNQTARTSRYLQVDKEIYDEKTVFFSLQHYIVEFLINTYNKDFFNRPKAEVISLLKRQFDAYLGKGAVDMTRFEDLHDLGYLPISIKALPEGAAVPYKVPYFTIKNTHPKFAWLTNYLETITSCEVWKPCYVATLTRELKRVCKIYADKTVGNYNHLPFQLHGFEFRGMSGRFDAAICGAAFLLNSSGTDTLPAIPLLEYYYKANVEKELVACSVPASEHAVSSIGTAVRSELEFFRDAITKYYPTGIVSLVSDTYDYFRVITEYATLLKEDILNRKVNEIGLAKVVFRPDSGDQVDIIVGDLNAPVGSPQYKGTIECLWDVFGGTINEKGYKELNPRVGAILGDGCTQPIIQRILEGLAKKGFASNNIVFGIGSFSLNFCSRDSIGAAQKATWTQVNGKAYNIFKDPITDTNKMKKSAKGLLRVDLVNGEYVLKDQCTQEEEAGGELKEVFRDGKLLIEQSLSEIRARVAASL